MSLPKVVLSGGLVASLLAAPPAEARFGKHADSHEASKPVHEATAIGSERGDASKKDGDKKDDENKNRSARTTTVSSTDDDFEFNSSASDDVAAVLLGALFEVLFSSVGHVIANSGTHQAVPEATTGPTPRDSMRHAVPFSFRMGALMAPVPDGTGADFSLGWDVEHVGVDLHLARLEGWTGEAGVYSARTLSEMHLTYSLIIQETLRVRVEGGVSTLAKTGSVLVGPSVGMSVEACVLGPLDAEARVQVTPFPYQQVDARAGLALHLGGLMLRGGMRSLFLSRDVRPVGPDRGFGPELGLGFVF
ncbi:hypothetical protein [Corallococcus sp. RDP092CA]|uniref:hypothetical protein n=1 Tax=Corallococcus sp. RDP092CA TaxID=3109369 RepID=UPI0035B014D9